VTIGHRKDHEDDCEWQYHQSVDDLAEHASPRGSQRA
jgi:hypothetical protein